MPLRLKMSVSSCYLCDTWTTQRCVRWTK